MTRTDFKSDPSQLQGGKIAAHTADFSDQIAFADHKIAYAVARGAGKDVLDIGCVQHNPEQYRSKYWVHKALAARARSLLGIDLSREGVDYLNTKGFNLLQADAQNFDLGRQFDMIFAGDIIEHLEDFSGFLESCKRHLRPGGQLVISTPNPWYWRYVVKACLSYEVKSNPEHTCWLCPRTLRQLARRHDLDLIHIQFSSRYARDRFMPLPRGLKHTTWIGTLVVSPERV